MVRGTARVMAAGNTLLSLSLLCPHLPGEEEGALTGSWASDIPQGWYEWMTFEYLHLGTGDTSSDRCTD